MSKNEYTADNIKLPSDTQHIFMRPGMYIGDTDNPKHLFVEATDNAIDEAMNGYSNLTEVNYDTKLNEVTVIDHGRGIPHGMKEIRNSNNKVIDKMSVLEILMTRNNSGGKFDNDSFKIRGGLHGLGMKIINALSDHVWIQTRRDGEAVTYESKNHGVKIGDIKVEPMDTSDNHGTEIHFTPTEDNIFEITRIPKQFIIDKCEIANAFGYKIILTINGKKIDLGEGSLSHLLPKADEKTSTYITKEFSSSLDDGESVRALLEYTSNTSSEYNAFTNLLFNSSGGTHVYSYQSALMNAWKPFIGDRFIKPSDVLLGSKSVIAVFIEDPLFSSQTKERLSVPKKQLENLFKGLEVKFHKFLEENKSLRDALLDRFEEYRMSQSKLQSQKEIDKLLIVNDSSKSNGKIRRRSVVPKLLECTSKDRSDTELYITEGDSAKGSIVQTRDVKHQAVFPVRGKVLNVAHNTNILDNLKNQEVQGIVNSIGASIGDKNDYTKSRYDRIIISADSDSDGAHIQNLLASLFINLLPDLVKNGMVYLLQSPLYGWTDKKTKKRMYGNNLEEAVNNPDFTRYKGLGEMDPEEFYDANMNTDNRKLVRLIYPDDVEEFNRVMTESSVKKEMLEQLGLITTRVLSDDLEEK